ncbi:hypothetical protein HYFRA_00006351 [Hymenoscyphus fraxineus]|uniref:Rhamnogalacturonase B N-terminal domain-containing protein n=1 Tax=Hymenoscyphus fraxineus TaxID=746836 RepID=A0A9N9KND5_9HELO|nr:hypothetical protein HYFRA_00006351 [Hymenoscyphus fraxineus]
MKCLVVLLFAALNLPLVFAAWGYTDNGSAYVVDTGASLVFSISKTNGDLSSIKYKGKEYNGYNRKNSHIQSGFGKSDVTIQQFTTPANIIKVTVTYGTIIQTYIARYGNNNIYMLTRKGDNTARFLFSQN